MLITSQLLAFYIRSFLIKCFYRPPGSLVCWVQDASTKGSCNFTFLGEVWYLFSTRSHYSLTPFLCDSLFIFCSIRIWSTLADRVHCITYYCLTIAIIYSALLSSSYYTTYFTIFNIIKLLQQLEYCPLRHMDAKNQQS